MLLSVNADCYTIWGYRREILLSLKSQKAPEEIKDLFAAELKFLEGILQHWPKSYWVWFQRQWVAEHHEIDFAHELVLCSLMHKADSRNFHCWNYRRFAAAKAKATAESELAITMSLIENDPSNYSAWHYRSILLPRKFSDAPDELSAAISEEFDLIKQAIWTDPSDQSAWLYHHWLVGVRKRTDKAQLMETIEQELGSCDELLAEEPNSRWAILTKALLNLEKGDFDSDALSSDLKKLQELDPLHKNYYESLLHRVNHTAV
eukprot:TRINITY_DN2608_c0_g1_i1.p1 TRINITY_DN2608_c0_g1~~TRINITY_DN2608_c0_g1_i1.p1  ORF type:complete len:262 (-),score=52.67 TRINITY_DN2608_c0_g1_i1:24-809(-)